jgi:hypothetical protein
MGEIVLQVICCPTDGKLIGVLQGYFTVSFNLLEPELFF